MTLASTAPRIGTPLASSRRRGARHDRPPSRPVANESKGMPGPVVMAAVMVESLMMSLRGDPAARIGIPIGDQKCHHPGQHRIAQAIDLSDADPLRCITQLLGRNLKQVAACYG